MTVRREHPNVKFLNVLRELTGPYRTVTEFAEACDKQVPNMSDYLRGNRIPTERVLSSCLKNVAAKRFGPRPLCEIGRIPDRRADIPDSSGVYIIYDSGGNALYIGRAGSFRTEVSQALNRMVPSSIRLGPDLSKKDRPKMRQLAVYYSLYEVDNGILQRNLEALLLRAFANQTHNTNVGRFVSVP